MKIEISETEVTNECILKEDEKILKTFFDLDEKSDLDKKSKNEIIVKFDEKKDFELAKALEKVLSYLTTSSTKFTFHVQLSVETKHQDEEQSVCEICSQKMKNNDERLENFNNEKIFSIFCEVFMTE